MKYNTKPYQLYNTTIIVMLYSTMCWFMFSYPPINVKPGMGKVGIWFSRKSNSPQWGQLTKPNSYLLIHVNEGIWRLVQIAGPDLKAKFQVKCSPKVHTWRWGLTLIGAALNSELITTTHAVLHYHRQLYHWAL